jgi:hypothetical protein
MGWNRPSQSVAGVAGMRCGMPTGHGEDHLFRSSIVEQGGGGDVAGVVEMEVPDAGQAEASEPGLLEVAQR